MDRRAVYILLGVAAFYAWRRGLGLSWAGRVGSAVSSNITTLVSGRTGRHCHTQIGEDRVSCDTIRPRNSKKPFLPPREDFQIEHISRSKGTFAIRSLKTGRYCTDADNGQLRCTADKIGPREQFTATSLGPGKVAIKGYRTNAEGRYCGDDKTNIGCTRTTPGAWEAFTGSNIDALTHPDVRGKTTTQGPVEGDSVRCDDGTGMIYRFTGGQLRYYPSPAIAQSWNPKWAQDIMNLTADQCGSLSKGPPMADKAAQSPATTTAPASTTPSAAAATTTTAPASTTSTAATTNTAPASRMSTTTTNESTREEEASPAAIALAVVLTVGVSITAIMYFKRNKM